jgi:hypothetical protein
VYHFVDSDKEEKNLLQIQVWIIYPVVT